MLRPRRSNFQIMRQSICRRLAASMMRSSPGRSFRAPLPVSSITPNSRQPRQVFEEEALAELVHSIGEVAYLVPSGLTPCLNVRTNCSSLQRPRPVSGSGVRFAA